jgi:hypothetical protein
MGAIDTTNTFTATDVITSAKMNNILDQSLMTATAIIGDTLAVTSGKLFVRAGGITSNEIGSNAVTTTAILDANVTPAKLSNSDFGAFTVASGVATLDANVVTTANILDANVTTDKILDANITASKLSGAQTGTAPIYGVRAWVNFDGTVAGTFAGGTSTVVRVAASTTATITTTNNHNLITGNKLHALTGVVVGTYVVTVTGPKTFTITTVATTALNTGITFSLRQIRGSGNVNSVSTLGTGQYAVNFTTALPDANYSRSGFANWTGSDVIGLVGGNVSTATTAQSCDIYVANSTNGSVIAVPVVNVMFVG